MIKKGKQERWKTSSQANRPTERENVHVYPANKLLKAKDQKKKGNREKSEES